MYSSRFFSESVFLNVCRITSELADSIYPVWKQIHENPELGYEEYFASQSLKQWLGEHNFKIQAPIAGMETAFLAEKRYTQNPPVIAYLAEYDALPNIGHACGHSLSGVISALAAAVLSQVATTGSIRVIGTPAEESVVPDAGGKLKCIDAGVFDGVQAVLMAHASSVEDIKPAIVARSVLKAEWFGVKAHAGASPHKGKNALTAAVIALNNINSLYQQAEADVRINAIMTHGGTLVNTIPDYASINIQVRAASLDRLDCVKQKIQNCVIAGSLVTGCKSKTSELSAAVSDFLHNRELCEVYMDALKKLGRISDEKTSHYISTDAGTVSYIVPSIHPMFSIGCDKNIDLHTASFTAACSNPEAWKAVKEIASALALTGLIFLENSSLQQEVLNSHKQNKH